MGFISEFTVQGLRQQMGCSSSLLLKFFFEKPEMIQNLRMLLLALFPLQKKGSGALKIHTSMVSGAQQDATQPAAAVPQKGKDLLQVLCHVCQNGTVFSDILTRTKVCKFKCLGQCLVQTSASLDGACGRDCLLIPILLHLLTHCCLCHAHCV